MHLLILVQHYGANTRHMRVHTSVKRSASAERVQTLLFMMTAAHAGFEGIKQ